VSNILLFIHVKYSISLILLLFFKCQTTFASDGGRNKSSANAQSDGRRHKYSQQDPRKNNEEDNCKEADAKEETSHQESVALMSPRSLLPFTSVAGASSTKGAKPLEEK